MPDTQKYKGIPRRDRSLPKKNNAPDSAPGLVPITCEEAMAAYGLPGSELRYAHAQLLA